MNMMLCGLQYVTTKIQKTKDSARLWKAMETISHSQRIQLNVHLFIYLQSSWKTVHCIQAHANGVNGSGGRQDLEGGGCRGRQVMSDLEVVVCWSYEESWLILPYYRCRNWVSKTERAQILGQGAVKHQVLARSQDFFLLLFLYLENRALSF